jgi:hypothetical protein
MPAGGFFILGDSLSSLLAGGLHEDEALSAADSLAQEIESDAQFNAPWNDRTGAARDGLEAEASMEGGEVVITLMHTVDFGLWLETIQSGRFAIIMPTLEKYAPRVHRAVAEGLFGD